MGPLEGVKAVEIAGIGPGPFCGMVLSDLGADVLRILPLNRPENRVLVEPQFDVLSRGRASVAIDLKQEAGRDLLLTLAKKADLVFEGFRPGVMERLRLAPDDLAAVNPRLVYGRMTGWGQTGPLAQAAGHDLNYIALAGALYPLGAAEGAPFPPLNLIGDYGGGGMLLAIGLLAGYIEAQRSGCGQVVDAAMVDGVALLMAMLYGMRAAGVWTGAREDNLLDGGAPWYRVYKTADQKFVSVAAIEPKFYRQLISILGLDEAALPPQYDKSRWRELGEMLRATFLTKTRDEWCAKLEGSDACFSPVLEMHEAALHPHLSARATVVDPGGVLQPAPAPRFSRTPGAIRVGAGEPSAGTIETFRGWGVDQETIDRLTLQGVIGPVQN